MSTEYILAEIEEKRKILEDMLSKNNIDLKNKEVLELSKQLDVLITKYIYEVGTRPPKDA